MVYCHQDACQFQEPDELLNDFNRCVRGAYVAGWIRERSKPITLAWGNLLERSIRCDSEGGACDSALFCCMRNARRTHSAMSMAHMPVPVPTSIICAWYPSGELCGTGAECITFRRAMYINLLKQSMRSFSACCALSAYAIFSSMGVRIECSYLVARKHVRSLSKAVINPPILFIIRSHLHRTSHHGREMVASGGPKVSKRFAIFMWEVCDPSNSLATGTGRPIGNGGARTH